MLNLFDRNGNDATIVNINRTTTRNGAYLYHVTLNFNPQNSNVVATAYVDPSKSAKMERLMHVYDRFKAGDSVHANLYQHNSNFIDIYRLQLNKPQAAPQPVESVPKPTVDSAALDGLIL